MVYEGRCRTTNEKVAVKIISYHTFKPQDQLRQKQILENEIRIMQKIIVEIPENKNLIRLKRVVREQSRMGIVMELLEGRELFERIVERKKYTERDAARLMRNLTLAVKSLHEKNILHRDLKPENLVFESEGEEAEIKISDFGLGCVVDWPDVHKSVVGTPNYVAPEVVSVKPRGPIYGPECDVWSLGVILYILLVGYPPFYHELPRELFKIIRKGKFEFHQKQWQGISELAKDLVRNMLVVDRTKRYTTDQVLSHPWLSQAQQDTNLSNTLSNLKKLNAKRRFKAAAMAVVWGAQLGMRRKLLSLIDSSVANVFTIQELSRIRTTFNKYSKNELSTARGTGATLTKSTFETALTELGFTELPIDRMFALFDQNGDGRIDYKEFLTKLATLRESGESALKLCFEIYDEEGNGFISKKDVEKVLSNVLKEDLAESEDEDVEAEIQTQLEKIFQAFDTNQDGKISYKEFTEGIFAKGPILVEHFLEPLDHIDDSED